MSAGAATTWSLPPQRATPEELAHQQALVQADQALGLGLDASLGMVFVLNRHRQVLHANETGRRFLAEHGVFRYLGHRPGSYSPVWMRRKVREGAARQRDASPAAR